SRLAPIPPASPDPETPALAHALLTATRVEAAKPRKKAYKLWDLTYRTAGTPSLETMARRGLWPTPTSTLGDKGGLGDAEESTRGRHADRGDVRACGPLQRPATGSRAAIHQAARRTSESV